MASRRSWLPLVLGALARIRCRPHRFRRRNPDLAAALRSRHGLRARSALCQRSGVASPGSIPHRLPPPNWSSMFIRTTRCRTRILASTPRCWRSCACRRARPSTTLAIAARLPRPRWSAMATTMARPCPTKRMAAGKTKPCPPRPVTPPIIDHPELKFNYREDSDTTLVVTLPRPVAHNESVTIEFEFVMQLPQKQGRWGQWKGVTFLSNWLPVTWRLRRRQGWQPTPFIPWHQPWFNEAGVYHARVDLPADRKWPAPARCRRARLGKAGSKSTLRSGRPRFCLSVQQCASAIRWRGRAHCAARSGLPGARILRATHAANCLRALNTYSKWFRRPSPIPNIRSANRTSAGTATSARPGHDRRARFRHAAPGDELRRLPDVARNLPSVVLQRHRHQWLLRNLDGRSVGHLFRHRLHERQLRQNNNLLLKYLPRPGMAAQHPS